ncbi:pleckstrin homology domain-containing family M member 2-like isoform X3 [Penaeus japonicus]|uniref:pleckstrin homology domain-containing family M member 2-like isoform X3 n=1 Tax=Penaeus japonicus TaxID=27405 RepID=UPI001C7106FF|nr:pleckstrin homology domain-containing family M member 2-like isoform X3 [Penaeus japonicus]
MAAARGGVKDRIVHEIGRAIKQAQLEWCGVGCVRACTGRWLVLSLDAALLHGLHALNKGYWPVVASLLDKDTLATVMSLPYATKPLTRGRAWICLCLNEGQLESYLHVLTTHQLLLGSHYGSQALLRDPHRTHLLLMLAAGLEHIRFTIPVDIPGWLASGGSMSSSSATSMSMSSVGSSIPSPSQHDFPDLDTTCSEALEESWGSKKKRRSRSSSQSSSRVSSGGTTPTDANFSTRKVQKDDSAEMGQRHSTTTATTVTGTQTRTTSTIPWDSSSSSSPTITSAEGTPKLNCDNYDRNVNNLNRERKGDRQENGYRKESENGDRLANTLENRNVNSTCDRTDDGDVSKLAGNEVRGDEVTVVRRGRLPNAKNVEKRVSFTDISDLEQHKPQHNRLSLCGYSEIRDLGDLRDLLSNLKDRGLLPTSIALDELFTSLDQSTPSLSERAPPEGQEDPPLHQSIISLTPSNADDDSNNNNNNSTDISSDAWKCLPGEKQEQGVLSAAVVQRTNIIDGLRWEELTKMGHELLEKATTDPSILDSQPITSTRALLSQEQLATGTRPKQKQLMAIKAEAQMLRDGMGRALGRKSKTTLSSDERRRLYKKSFRRDKAPPSLYIPVKVDNKKFREEERRLALEVAQGQSNLVTPGRIMDYKLDEWIMTHVLALPEEKLYRVFAAREGHSSGHSIGVQVVLSTQTLYILAPRLKGSKPRHILPYHDIHTIIVGANDQWLCVLSKEAVHDDLATTGSNTGIQLDVGDPDVTHAIVSCLELAIRRHFAALKLGTMMKKEEIYIDYRDLFPPGKLKLTRSITRECEDNLSNSLLEESLLNAWDTRKNSADHSHESSEVTQDLSAATPGSVVSQDLSEASQDLTEASHDLTEESHDLTEPSHDLTEASHELIEDNSDITEASQDISEASQDMTETSQDSSEASNDLTDPSPESVDESQDMTDASQASVDASEEDILNESQSPRSMEGSQQSSYMSQTQSSRTQIHSKLIQTSANTSQDSFAEEPELPANKNEVAVLQEEEKESENGNITEKEEDKVEEEEEETEEETCPAHIHLEKQYGMPIYAGGYSRWNGTLHDRSLPAVVVHPAWELAGLRRWLRAQLRLQSGPEVVGCWMADWEDGSSLGGDAVSGPLGPTNEGPLMFKPPGILSSWRPAYFILKAGVLYQFNDARERLPHMIVEVVQCVGCVRISSSHRPYAFQLLRKKAPPVMLAASDEHEASLWLQAFLMIINNGVPDVSERKQVSCRVILLESGVLLAQQSDLILALPQDNGPSSIDYQTAPDPRSSTTNLQQSQQPALASSPRHSQTPQAQLERKDSQKPLNLALSNLKERKHLSSSLTALNRTNSTPSMPGSPLKRANSANKSSTPKKLQHQGSLTRLTDYGSPDAQASSSSTKEEKDPSPPAKKNKEALVRSSSTPRRKLEEITQGIQAKGEVKVLTYSALEHLSSLYLYAECPNTCLMEFECSEAGEISGDWALYFRTGSQLHEFITTLSRMWSSMFEMDFPVQTVEDAGVQQYLLEGSQISTSGWSSYHL